MTTRLPALTFVALLLVAGCRPGGTQGTPDPGFTIGDDPLAYADTVAAYAERLEFNEYEGAADVQLLHREPCPPGGPAGDAALCRHGPTVALQPYVRSHQFTRAELAQGRLIARLENRDTTGYGDTTGAYRYALAPNAVVYWWVDSTAAGRRSIFFRASPDRAAVVDSLTIHDHPELVWRQASARWLWGSTEIAWATCGDRGCCQSGGAEQ